MPLTQTRTVQKLRYLTDPLPRAIEVTGPLSLHFWAEIDQEDTTGLSSLRMLDPMSRSRPQGRERWTALKSMREITRGWLKASHRAVIEEKSLPGQLFHPLTRRAQKKVVSGEVNRYDVEIAPTSNVFKRDHCICVEITSLDIPTGVAGDSRVEYIPCHLCSGKTVVHKVYRCQKYPSYLMLPIILENPD